MHKVKRIDKRGKSHLVACKLFGTMFLTHCGFRYNSHEVEEITDDQMPTCKTCKKVAQHEN